MWLYPHFNALGLTHPSFDNLNRKQYFEIIFSNICSNSKLEKYLKKLNLEYAIYGEHYFEGFLIFQQGQKKRYLNNEYIFP